MVLRSVLTSLWCWRSSREATEEGGRQDGLGVHLDGIEVKEDVCGAKREEKSGVGGYIPSRETRATMGGASSSK